MALDDKDIERLREIFVTRKDCDVEMKSMDEKVSPIVVRMAVLEQQQKVNNWLTALIASGVIAALIKLYLGA